MWKKFIHDYLSYTRQERRGILVVCILILLCWCVPPIVEKLKKDPLPEAGDFKKEVALFNRMQDSLKKKVAPAYISQNILTAKELPEPFPFNPNTLNTAGWISLGLPMHEVKTIQHYLSAGGHFYKKEDLKKIYGLSSAWYERLAPYINIPKTKNIFSNGTPAMPDSGKANSLSNAKYKKEGETYKTILLDVNTADSTAWVKLRGIGPVLSSRIIRFRKALGGFYSLNQVKEVYGLPDSTFQGIKQQLKISTIALKKLNINTATVDELKSHPYISYRLAASIKAFRDQHGDYDSIEALKQLQLVDDQIYRKLAPYLTVK